LNLVSKSDVKKPSATVCEEASLYLIMNGKFLVSFTLMTKAAFLMVIFSELKEAKWANR
jgi:hypothetical protein